MGISPAFGSALAIQNDSLENGSRSLPVLSLDTVLNRVLARNPELDMWKRKAESKSAQAEGARAWMAPEIGIGGIELPYGMGESGAMNPGDPALMFSVRQMVPGWGKRGAHARYLASLCRGEAAGGEWMKATLIAEAKSRYFRMATAEHRLAVLGEAEAVMAYMLKVAETRFKHRQADLATVQEAKARLEELGSMRIMERSDKMQSASALKLLMADSSTSGFAVDTVLALRGYADRPSDSILVGSRSDLAQVDAGIRSMELNLEWMRRQARPDFGIQFDHMEMLDMGRRFSVMAMVSLPSAPWSKGMVRSEVNGMNLEVQAMRSEQAARKFMALRMAREMHLMLKAETEQSGRYTEKVVPAYRMSLDAAMAVYQEGSGDLFRVLDTWDRWVMARLAALEHLGRALVLEAEYERETGKQ
ncbi:MAG: TolC family protein [Fibrobacteria bacterium]